MSKIDLLPHEVILRRDSCVEYDPGVGRPVPGAELLLTNKALLVVIKGFVGNTKEVVRFPLDSILEKQGKVMVQEGISRSGQRQMHVFFAHGVESFTLGEGDEEDNDSPGSMLKNLFTSQAEKESRYLQEWCKAVSDAVLAEGDSSRMPFDGASVEGKSFLGSAVATVSVGVGAATKTHNSLRQDSCRVTQRCMGCSAPLLGRRGERVVCKYCDTEQTISEG